MQSSIINIMFFLYAFFLGMLVYGVRKAVESKFEKIKSAYWWNDIALYFLPILLGGSLAILMKETGSSMVPELLHSKIDVAIWGSIAGGLSGFVYTVGRKMLKQKATVAFSKDDSSGKG